MANSVQVSVQDIPELVPEKDFSLNCPIPIRDYPNVLLAHGSGGKLMHDLIERMIVPAFSSPLLNTRHDGAVFGINQARLAFTTDSYVVHPLFFPGGDIGKLAVCGTVNDLAMSGAQPMYLSVSFIIEEGLPMETLWRVIESMKQTAAAAGVQIVTGDTKVVDRGKGDGIFINTSGIGIEVSANPINPQRVQIGDAVILSGDLGRHGMAIMAVREGLAFESTIESDCAPLAAPVLKLIEAGMDIHCLRDLTRGGLASGLVEIAETANVHVHFDETVIQVREDVRGACEILGLDPMYVANEGRFVAFVAPGDAERAVELLRTLDVCENAAIIGYVNNDSPGQVTMRSSIGANRIVDMLSGEQLPRIC
jgi:hydrogenase expression/formation protein HypE